MASEARRLCVKSVGELGQDVARAEVEDAVNGVEAQPVHVIFGQPVERVVDEEPAHLVAVGPVEVERGAPGRLVAIGEVGAEVLAGSSPPGRGGCRRRRGTAASPCAWQASTSLRNPAGPPYAVVRREEDAPS